MADRKTRNELFFSLLLVCAMAFWGGAWSIAKLITDSVSVQTVVFYRFLISSAAVFPLIFFYNQRLRISHKVLLWSAGGAVLFTIYNQLFFTGVKLGFAGAAGVLVTSTNPIFTYVLTILLFKHRMTKRSALGLLIGFIGGCFMLRLWTLNVVEMFRLGNGLLLSASIVWACVTLINGHAQKKIHFSIYTFYFYLLSSIFSLPFSLMKKDTLIVFRQDVVFWIYLLYLSLFAMAFAASIFFLASSRLGGRKASHFVFLIPAFALLFSFLLLGEIPKWYTVTGGAMALIAVYILNRQRE